MNEKVATAIKVVGTAAVGAVVIAIFRVSDEQVYAHREGKLDEYYKKHPRWTDKNRWE